jgi:hypothetical protein
MLLGWLLPDASYQVLFEGWDRQQYRPRHGKPPLVVRGAYSAAVAFGRARERYLGTIEDEARSGAPGRQPRSADLAPAPATDGLTCATGPSRVRLREVENV